MKRSYKFFAGLALFTLLLAGCNSGGSSGGGGGSDNPPVTEDSYTITWKNWNGIILETDNNVKKGTLPTYDGATPTRPDDDEYTYTWSGWDPEVVPATSNQTYVATYSYERLTTTYTINFDLNGGTSASYSGPKTVEVFSKDIFFFDCVKEGWNFRGWSYNGTKIFDEKGNQLTNPTMAKTMTFVAMYAQTAKMTIISNLEGAGNITGEGEYPYNTYVDVSAYAKQGYVFIGWYYQNTLLSNTNDYKYMMWSEDVTLEARFKLDSFLMNVHTNNEDYGLVLLRSTVNNNYLPEYQEYRDYTTPVTIAAYSKTDVRFLGWYDTENKLVETNAVYNFVMPNYDYTLEAKWNYFTVTYNLNGGTNNSSNPTSYSIDSSKITLREPTRTGYDFTGWTYNGRTVTEVDPTWIENITLVANWRAHTYSISYELNGGTNNSSNPTSYTIESSTITLKDATRNGYTFAGWYKTSTFSNKVTTIDTGSHGDLVLYAKWIPISYSITYNLDGGTNNSDNPSTYTIESSFNFADATKTGYQFAGWFDDNGNRVTFISAGTTGALILTAHWTAKLNNLSVTSEDTSKGTVAITSGSGYSYESITVVATPVGDCIFKGWYHESTEVSDAATYTFIMPMNDYYLVAHFFTKAEEEEELRRLGGIPALSDDGKTITYGLYPQTNVNNSSLVSALNALTTPESNGWYLYNNDYYAKVSAENPFSSSYRFDNGTTIVGGTTYWFKCEPITWNVLSNTNGEYYIVSSVLLDAHCYYNSISSRTIDGQTVYANNYEYSDIRTWLNNDFYNSAFALGNSHIQITTVDNSAVTIGPTSNSYACNNTEDKVFLPSYQDYINSDYDFSTSYDDPTDTRYCKTTDWARARGARYYTNSSYPYLYNGYYWTRSPSALSDSVRVVREDGCLVGGIVYNASISVRPALTIKMPSYYGKTPILSEDGKTLTYGLYPQKNVNDSTLVSALNALTTPESNGWYLYEGDYYAKVSAKPNSSGYVFDNGATIVSGTTYWFKCEPIVWNVLSNNNGEYYIASSVLLDAHCYYNSTSSRTIDGQIVYANNYEYSDIRTWLNNDFYNSAFALGNSHIQTTTVDNSEATTNSTSNSYACANTEDKVFLPSYQDYINSSYGISSKFCKTTDWARARGAYYYTSSGSYQYNGYYWTRSPSSDGSGIACRVDYGGSLGNGIVYSTYYSVRPALTIKIA